jgi:hypothetical protein
MPAPLAAIPLGLTPAGFRILQGIMSAAKNAPRSAPKDIPSMLRPTTPTNPLNTVVRDPVTGRMVSTMGYSPTQIAASRAGVATGAGTAGAATYGALPTLDSFLPRRAEGDPAAAMNRRNASSDPGRSDYDALYSSLEAPSGSTLFDREGLPDDTLGGFTAATPRQDEGRADYNSLFQSLMAAPQNRGPASTGSTPSVSASAPAEQSLMGRLFSGPDYQSNNQAVVSRPQGPMADGSPQRTMLNFGDSDNAADFFRADKAMQELQRNKEDFVGMASGGAANGSNGKASNGRDAALHKALEIIHHMMVNRR